MENNNFSREERTVDLRDVIKAEVENQIATAGAADIIKVIKVRTAELTIALQEFDNLRNLTNEDRQKAMGLLQVIADNLNVFTELFDKNANMFREELKTQNTVFTNFLEEGKPFEDLKNTLMANVEKNNRRLNERLDELEKKVEESRKGGFKYFFLILLIVLGFAGIFFIQQDAIISIFNL